MSFALDKNSNTGKRICDAQQLEGRLHVPCCSSVKYTNLSSFMNYEEQMYNAIFPQGFVMLIISYTWVTILSKLGSHSPSDIGVNAQRTCQASPVIAWITRSEHLGLSTAQC
jgi:hypothetical protein